MKLRIASKIGKSASGETAAMQYRMDQIVRALRRLRRFVNTRKRAQGSV